MTVDRPAARYLLAGVIGLTAATIAVWQLDSSVSTRCARMSVSVEIDSPPAATKELDAISRGCPQPPFGAVLGLLRPQLRLAETDPSFVPDGPDTVNGLAAILVWEALFAATAGIAATTAALTVFKIADLLSAWHLPGKAVWIDGLIAIAIIAVPFVVLRSLSRDQLSPFDLLHKNQLLWMPPVIALLTVPAASGLLLIRRIVVSQHEIGLEDLADLGSHMRDLISALGAILSLAVLGTASRWQMIATLPGGEGIPSTLVLLWGAVFAAVLAAIYVPVYERWSAVTKHAIAAELREQFSAYEGPGTHGYRPPELAAKRDLQATLGFGGALRTLQGSFAVLAPIIAAAVSSLFAS